VTVNSKEENSEDFYLDFGQDFGLWGDDKGAQINYGDLTQFLTYMSKGQTYLDGTCGGFVTLTYLTCAWEAHTPFLDGSKHIC
jgi:hypothetical protein